ncbi:hypothetical protein C8J56DRAFT_1042879 [Mycena floridula]|nr:hypothetical protein C8J56DRAFT_1042879 [Mycena floridula]
MAYNIDYSDHLVAFSIHGDDLARTLKEDHTRTEILGFTNQMMRDIQYGQQAAARNISEFLSTQTSLIHVLHALRSTDPTLTPSPGYIDRCLLYFSVHCCNNDYTNSSESLRLVVLNLIKSMDTLVDTMFEWKLVEKELQGLQQEIRTEKALLCDVQVPKQWMAMGKQYRLQSAELRNSEDLCWNVLGS